MFSTTQKQKIAIAIQDILRATSNPELPKGEIHFLLHIDGAKAWSWANIRNNSDAGIHCNSGLDNGLDRNMTVV